DLNGDGADDAVAIVIEQLGGSAWDVMLAAYVDDSGAPSFSGSVGFGYAAVDSVTVESGIITVTGRQVGNRDAICCPTKHFQYQFTLQRNQLVDVSGASSSTTGQSAPAPNTTSTLSQSAALALKGFPGAVLLLPVDE